MRKSKQLLNLPVFSLEEGQQIGKVKGLVIDPAKKAVVALIIEEKGWLKEQKFIPFSQLRSIGENAITVERSNSLQRGATLPEILKLTRDKVDVTGTRIVLENGTILGQVDEFYIDLQTGEIVGLEFSEGMFNHMMQGRAYLDASFIRTLGRQVTVCTEDCLNNLVKIEGGFQDTLRSVKNTATQAWSSAVHKSRELSTGINFPFRRKTNNGARKEQAPPGIASRENIIPENIPPEKDRRKEEPEIK
ncbi:MAG: PRC-barrel domain-containing protein [Armatimonadetes bacterium]|nr:PRC-barrel domain-containing protein [Armatimonadota bacterium]